MLSNNQQDTLDKVINHIGFLMNVVDPAEELNKMMALELTINPEAKDLNYREILNIVILKLIRFYQDKDLEDLWSDFIISPEIDDSDDDQVA